MVILREEEGNRDLCLTQLRPTLVLLSSVLYFTSHRLWVDSVKGIFSKTSQHLSWYSGSRQDEFNPLAGVKSDTANNKQR